MFKTALAITGACVVYFAIGAAMTAGCYLGMYGTQLLIEKFEK